MYDSFLDSLFERIDAEHDALADPQSYSEFGEELRVMLDSEVLQLLNGLLQRSPLPGENSVLRFLEFVFGNLLQRAREEHQSGRFAGPDGESMDADPAVLGESDAQLLDRIERLYRSLPPAAMARNQLLGWLAYLLHAAAADRFVSLLVEDPPLNSRAIVISFKPLFDDSPLPVHQLFPRILEAIQYVEIAAAVIDLANFLFRDGRVQVHPAAQRRQQLAAMLDALVDNLAGIEGGRLPERADPESTARQLENSVALSVSLCDALALIDDRDALPTLRRVARLTHRRIRTEAAAALLRLGDQQGRQMLLELLNEPVARLRVLAYASELGFADQVPQEFLTEESRAESELAIWLSQPTQLGFAPSHLQVVHRQTMFWPGFEDPVDCFLVRFEFSSAAGVLQNVGIVGPLTFVFAADMSRLSRWDCYAAYAGWQAQSDEIFDVAYEKACVAWRNESDQLLRVIESSGYREIQPQFVGVFFGEKVLVCAAVDRDDSARNTGCVIVDQEQTNWFPCGSELAPVCADLAWCIYRGRRLLRHFNPQLEDLLAAEPIQT